MDKSGPFKAEVSSTAQGVRITISGVIDEKANFPSFDSLGKTIEIDLKNVHYMNSYGVRMWSTWMLQHKGAKQMILDHVPAVIIKQINIFRGFLSDDAIVRTLYAPYINPVTMEDKQVLLIHGVHYKKNSINLPVEKARDGTLLEPDFFVEQFFKFLNR